MICKKCGEKIPENTAVCPKCGAKAAPDGAEQAPPHGFRPKTSIVIIIILLAAMLALGAAAIAIIHMSESQSLNEPQSLTSEESYPDRSLPLS